MPAPESSTLAARHARFRQALGLLGLDTCVITSAANVRYLTNHDGTAGVVVVGPDHIHLLVDPRYDEAVRSRQQSPAACPSLRPWPVPASYDEALVQCLLETGPTRVGFEANQVSVARHRWLAGRLEEAHGSVALEPTHGVVEGLRMVKDASELATIREAASRLSSVAATVFDAVSPGMDERALAGVIEGAMRHARYERPAFDTIVASGPNAALPHHRAGDRVLTPGDLVVLDFGGVLDGYCCDLTRTVSVGRPSAEAERIHRAVLEAQAAAIDAVRPGVATDQVDAAARNVLQAHGMGAAFVHGTGHGFGLEIHEAPRVGPSRPDTPSVALEAGMVVTIEPGAYFPGFGGVRLEDDILVTETGHDVLTAVPRGLRALKG